MAQTRETRPTAAQPNIQDVFLNYARREKLPLHIRLMDGSDFEGRVSDSGEGRWTSIAAIEEGVPAGVLTTALYERFASRNLDDFADRVLSAMRYQFGGHKEKPK